MYRARKYLLMHRSGGRSQINRLCDLVTEAAGIMIMASILFILFSNNFCHSDSNTDERKTDFYFMANLLSLNQYSTGYYRLTDTNSYSKQNGK